jgi:hypothetical protein
MIGDFNDSANSLWALHLEEAKSHDEARIHSLKDDMDTVLIFVSVTVPLIFSQSLYTVIQAGLFSAALTSFLIDSVNSLQVDPAKQMVYYQQQNVALLAQISKQVASIAPQVSIPSTPPPPYPDFSPSSSDVRVNAFWFMSLIFSLVAALLATLVQQWVRDYMHVFQRYSNPLKGARLRQYLYEGVEGWYMPRVARAVPGLVHISLFLFFAGLVDSLLATYTTVGVTTTIPIAICSSLYVLSTFAPAINPQCPFRNPFAGLMWYLKQKVHPWRYLDRAAGGTIEAVSSNLSEGQIQLAMEENRERKYRDVRAVQWLIHNRTEDDEMESFVMAIPGAFTSQWGIDVWRKVSEIQRYEDANLKPDDPTVRSQSDADLPISDLPRQPFPHFLHTCPPLSLLHPLGRVIGIRTRNSTSRTVAVTRPMSLLSSTDQAPNQIPAHRDRAIYDLCERVRHLVGTCEDHSVFTNQGLWLRRTRGCIETVASLVLNADINPELFGDLGAILVRMNDFFGAEYRQLSAPGSDGLCLVRWTYLSFVVVNRGIANDNSIKLGARLAINNLSRFGMGDGGEQSTNGDDDADADSEVDENALRNAQRIDNYFESAKQFCVHGLREAFRPSGVEVTKEQVIEVLARDYEVKICMLEHISALVADDCVKRIDQGIFRVMHSMLGFADGLISLIRGAYFDTTDDLFDEKTGHFQPILFFNPRHESNFLPQFVYLHQRLRFLCSYSSKLRDIVDKQDSSAYEETLESLGELWDQPERTWSSVIKTRHLMERQLWRLQDIRDGDSFGFWVERFFPVAYQMLGIPLSHDAQSTLILGVFRVITSDWRQHKNSIGTQRVILNLVCDLAIPEHGLASNLNFPRYITDELLILLENMVEGPGSHIDEAIKELEDAINEQPILPGWATNIGLFRAEAVKVISRLQAPASPS